jgi:hypothetical protein
MDLITVVGQLVGEGASDQVSYLGGIVVRGANDNMHFFWKDLVSTKFKGRTLDPTTNGLSTIVGTTNTAPATVRHIGGRGFSYDDGGTQRISIPWRRSSELNLWRLVEDGSGDLAVVDEVAVSGITVASLVDSNAVIGSALESAEHITENKMHIVWIDQSGNDLYRDESESPHSTWGIDVLERSGTFSGISANAFIRDFDVVVGLFIEGSTNSSYDEVFLGRQSSLRSLRSIGR